MKKFQLIIMTCLIGTICHAQTNIIYTYDNNGNVISRTSQQLRVVNYTEEKDKMSETIVKDITIKHFIDNNIIINVTGDRSFDVQLYDTSGSLLYASSNLSRTHTINLNIFPNEIFILKISSTNGTYSEKIIKTSKK